MRVIRSAQPFHRVGFSTAWIERTPAARVRPQLVCAMGLFLLAALATATISMRSPWAAWAYCLGIFLLCLYATACRPQKRLALPGTLRTALAAAALALISLWGFAQLAVGTTEYRHGTWDASLRMAALGGTAYLAAYALGDARLRTRFLRTFAWFGFAVSVISFAAYFTSPDRVLWFFASPYPDVWGPFLSRNDFAGFLELSLPVALWMSLRAGPADVRPRLPLWVPAWMLAAGVASGSRAGAALLAAEAAAAVLLSPRYGGRGKFAAFAVLFIGVTGAGALWGRLGDSDPLRYRREIAASTVPMIAERPWTGFGLGTYAQVYPAYATFDTGASVEHAHNYWLEWAAEGGIPLALTWVALACAVLPGALRSRWGLGIIAVFLHALVDYPFARFGLTAWTFTLIGAVLVSADEKFEDRHTLIH